jgi:tripartite-type tricarboxylate transporter receptor subunit TctC
LSRQYARHIPGAPRLIVINQPGAGGLLAINHAAVAAPQDGTFLALASQALLIFEATGQRGLHTSLGNFKWLGSFTQSNNVTVTWHTSRIKTLEDAKAHEVTVGASGAGGGSNPSRRPLSRRWKQPGFVFTMRQLPALHPYTLPKSC